jgi:hypothetical protein
MTDDEIEAKVQEVLKDWELEETMPIDPLHIAKEEGIEVLPGDYDDCIEGRIEYHKENGIGQFYLMYGNAKLPFRPDGRVRFSIAHELGHFYLTEHRKYLLSGRFHNSVTDFVSTEPWEREADKFAASLLMPTEMFRDQVRDRADFLTLQDLSNLASNVFQTSLTSTVRRYVDMNFEPCCMVMAEKGVIKWSKSSEDMRKQALGWTNSGSKLPPNSLTAKAIISKLSGTQLTSSGSVDSSVWFNRQNSCQMFEETLLLTNWGRTLTFITLEHSRQYDD